MATPWGSWGPGTSDLSAYNPDSLQVYSRCISCNGRLRANNAVEAFPVGRTLAFDPARGRLWVVCRRCSRWNLTPIEERWEAIEACQILFESAVRRYSTENIGIARHGSGLDLVRVGRPKGREFAFWRYGDAFTSRWARNALWTSIAVIAGSAGAWGNLFTGGAAFVGLSTLYHLGFIANLKRPVARVPCTRYENFTIRRQHLGNLCVVAHQDGTADLRLNRFGMQPVHITGDNVGPVLLRALPVLNKTGSQADLDRAVGAVIEGGGPSPFARSALADPKWKKWAAVRPQPQASADIGYVASMPVHLRLGLEMALSEEREEAALAGELSSLEAAWREAEEIAAIADNLLLPESWLSFRNRHRGEAPQT